jgi:hypothetical protein
MSKVAQSKVQTELALVPPPQPIPQFVNRAVLLVNRAVLLVNRAVLLVKRAAHLPTQISNPIRTRKK